MVSLLTNCRRAPFAGGWLLAAVVLCLAPSPRTARADWPLSSWFAKPAVGTPEWWKKNKNKSEFVPGKGYAVQGVEGFFDQDGRPIQNPVAVERIDLNDEAPPAGLLPGLDPKQVYSKVKTSVGLGPNDKVAHEAFQRGEELFGEQRYGAASEEYSKAAGRASNASLKQDAMFMLAESYFFDDRYIKARDSYNALVAKYPSTHHMDVLIEREWKIARYWEQYEEYSPDWTLTPNFIDRSRPKLDTIGHAIKTYDNIRMNDPTGPRADDAIMATANIYFRQGKYEDADYHYSLLRREYPRSEFQFEAHLLGLQSKMRKYQGADYDGTPLEEAKDLVKQLRVQFAGQLNPEEKERLRVVSAQLNQEIAARDFRMAKFYDKTKHYGSAKVYYAEVLKKYPNTDMAQESRERVAQIAGEPDDPPKRLAWFVDLFPESRERAELARIPELQDGGTRLAKAPKSSTGEGEGSTEPTTVK
jgi:outer membrane protein assembly factor BamD (BamD/ComL family)